MSTSIDPKIAVSSEKATVIWRKAILRSNGHGGVHPTDSDSRYVAYVMVDLLFIIVNAAVVFSSRFVFDSAELSTRTVWAKLLDPVLLEQIEFSAVFAVLLLLAMGSEGLYQLYRPRSLVDDIFAVTKSVTFATLLLIAIIYISGVKTVSRIRSCSREL